jgi:hypothetical protein
VAIDAKSWTLPDSKFGPALAYYRGNRNALRQLARCADAGADEAVITAPQQHHKVSQIVRLGGCGRCPDLNIYRPQDAGPATCSRYVDFFNPVLLDLVSCKRLQVGVAWLSCRLAR